MSSNMRSGIFSLKCNLADFKSDAKSTLYPLRTKCFLIAFAKIVSSSTKRICFIKTGTSVEPELCITKVPSLGLLEQ